MNHNKAVFNLLDQKSRNLTLSKLYQMLRRDTDGKNA